MERCFTQADLNKARMRREFRWGERCGRGKLRLAAATSMAGSDRHRQSQCLRVLQRSTAVCAGARNTKSLATRANACGGSDSRCRAGMRCGTRTVRFSAGDVAACDVQAATSQATHIAQASTKSRSFAGDGTGQRGKTTRQSPNL